MITRLKVGLVLLSSLFVGSSLRGDALGLELPPASGDDADFAACNIAPYTNEVVFLAKDGTESRSFSVEPGLCYHESFEFSAEGLFVYIRATDSDSLRRLQLYDFFAREWGGRPATSSSNADVWACVDRVTAEFIRFDADSTCPTAARRIELGYIPGSAREYFLLLEDPFVCARMKPVCEHLGVHDALKRSKTLARSLETSLRAWSESDEVYGLIPTASGLETVDFNGPFVRGILVTEQQANRTPLGSPVPAIKGDIIVAFNGEPVFDRDDFIMLLIDHGVRGGYETPYDMEIIRSGYTLKVSGYLVFHRDIFGPFFLDDHGLCKNRSGAMLSSALEAATFYTKPVLACVDFDVAEISLERSRQCEFSVRQITAAYKQYCPELTDVSGIVGSVFMPGRETTGSVVRRLAFKNVSRAAPPLLSDAADGVARALITLPPGLTAENSWRSIAQQSGVSVAAGTGARAIFRR